MATTTVRRTPKAPKVPKPRPLARRAAWKALQAHYKTIRETHLRTLFEQDSRRGERMTIEGAGLFLDYSKNRIIDQTIKLLLQLANVSCLRERIDAMFAYSTVALTSVHLKSSPHDDPGQPPRLRPTPPPRPTPRGRHGD